MKRNLIKKLVRLETLIHCVMVTFAIASMFNIATYLSESHHIVMSWSIGVSLSFGLVALSLALSGIDTTNKPLFIKMLIATVLLCLLSGTVQMLSYQSHGQPIVLSIVFGYGFPFVAELVLALAISEYDKDKRQQKIRNAQQGIRETTALVLSTSLDNYDQSLIQDYVNTQITGIVQEQVEETIKQIRTKTDGQDSLGKTDKPRQITDNTMSVQDIETRQTDTHLDTETDKQLVQDILSEVETILSDNRQTETDTVDRQVSLVQDKTDRQSKTTSKLEAFVDLLLSKYEGHVVDELDKRQLATELECSTKTIERHIKTLRQDNRLNGHVDRQALVK